MIHPNEARIGNLVRYDNKVFKIDTISREFPTLNTTKYGIGVVTWADLQPIPLTEEWLLKLGADKYNPGRYMLKLSETLIIFWNIGDDYFICELSSRSTHVCYFNEKKHVHQLQNLFYALTEKELTLKIKQ